MLRALLKQVVRGLEEVSGEIMRAYEYQEKVIGGRVSQLAGIVKIASSGKRASICMALGTNAC